MQRGTLALVVFFVIIGAYEVASAQQGISLATDVGLGGVGGTAYTTVQSGIDIREGGLALGVFGRLRVAFDSDDAGPVRRRDWDETTDYVHVLRYLDYRRSFGDARVHFRAGELLGYTLGHGTLLRDYSNAADPDHPRTGVRFELDHRRFGLALMVDNIVDPSVVAGRFYLRPVERFETLILGASAVIDPRAPVRVLQDAAGRRRFDGAFNLLSRDTTLALGGLDAEVTLGSRRRGLTPYVDLNGAFFGGPGKGAGVGLHAGLKVRAPLGKTGASLAAQAEYRLSSAGYAPAYVRTFYDIDRFQAGLTFADPSRADPARRSTKLSSISTFGEAGHGLLAQIGLEVQGRGRIKLGFSRAPGPDKNRLWLRLSGRPLTRLHLGALLLIRGLGEPADGASGVAALAEVRYRVSDYLYALGQYSRRWSLRADNGYFGVLQSFNVAFGGNWSR